MRSISTHILILVILTLSYFADAQSPESILEQTITLQQAEWSLEKLLEQVTEDHGIVFSYGTVQTDRTVALSHLSMSLSDLLNELFSESNISYTIKNNKVLLYKIDKENKSLFDQSIEGRVIQNDKFKTPLYGATLIFKTLNSGTTTGLNGAFSAERIPRGRFEVSVSFIGFKTKTYFVNIPSKTPYIFEMEEDLEELEVVEIQAQNVKSTQAEQAPLSTINIAMLPLTDIPRLLGEPDLIRMIQNLPGVKTESDFTGGFSVRGGRNDQNLILLDGVPVYNPWHLFGLFSAFNTEAIESVELTKGVFPAQYGSRVSAVLDIELQKGDKRLGAGYLTISPISASFSYGRPLNQKTSYLFALRRTFLDPIFWGVNAAASSTSGNRQNKLRTGYNFMDLNAKVVHTFKPGTSLEAGIFVGNDVLDVSERIKRRDNPEREKYRIRYGWTNLTGSVKLINKSANMRSVSHLFVSQYFSNNVNKEEYLGKSQTPNSWSGGQVEGFALVDDIYKQRFRQKFTDVGFQQDYSRYISDNFTVYVGAQSLFHFFREDTRDQITQTGYPRLSGQTITDIPDAEPIFNLLEGDTLVTKAVELGAYVGASWSIGKLDIHPSVRLQYYTQGSHSHILPRLNMTYHINDAWYVAAGYGHFTQYLQTVGFELLRLPAERWFWANGSDREPVFTRTFTGGIGYEHPKWGRFTAEGYYKTFDNLLNFTAENQSRALESEFIPLFGAETVSGTGEAYGAEFLWQKTKGDLSGWFGYTLSWVWNQFDDLNRGDRFPSRTDKRHDFQTFWTYDFATNWSIGALFNFKTGQPVTLSTGTYLNNPDPLEIRDEAGDNQVVARMNDFRLPAYHRLDMSLTWKNRKTFKRRSELSLNVVNVYNRLNVLTATNGTSTQVLPNGKVRINPNNKYSGQMPIIPMLSLRIALGGDAI